MRQRGFGGMEQWQRNCAVVHITATRRTEVRMLGGRDATTSAPRCPAVPLRPEEAVLRTRLLTRAALIALLSLGACDSRVSTEPSYEPQVVNLPNDFAYQASSLVDVTDERVYTWQSDGTSATVNQIPTGLTGTASLFVYDGAGNQVYQHALTDTGTFATAAGAAGIWSVRVRFEDANGALSFRLKKP
jgi:hypothetical protein